MTTNKTTITPINIAIVDAVVVVIVNECVEKVMLSSALRFIEGNKVGVTTNCNKLLLSSAVVIKVVACNGVDCVDCSNEADLVGVMVFIKVVSARVDSTTIKDYN